tara:strand:+ start:5128 stop:6066 length:939 start_codon:yes stop_codon:yes gene_type:complete
MQKTVDIIVNCFNGEKYLSEALDSILKQGYKSWRVIFIDNCSTDNSKNIAKKFKGNLIYHKTEKKISLGAARKLAVNLSESDYIAFLDCDDTWEPDKLEDQVNTMQSKEVVLTFSGINYIDDSGKNIGQYKPKPICGNLFREKLKNYDINILTSLIKRNFLLQNNLNFSSEMEASEEYNLFMKIASLGKINADNRLHANYRILEDSLTNKFKKKWAEEREITLEQIIKKDRNLKEKYEEDINIAFNRASYYKACFFMDNENFRLARKELRKISKKEKLYFPLYILAFFPKIWVFFHKREIKEKLTRIFINRN